MTFKKSVYIIIPFYNESGLYKNIFENRILDQYQLILVDDGSDKPADFSLVTIPFYLITHDKNLGQGAALQTGMELANSLKAGVVVHFDADGQHRAEEIEQLIKPVESKLASIVLGSRFLNHNNLRNPTKVLPVRKFILHLARVFQFYFTGVWLSDSQNGFRAIDGNALPLIEIKQNRMAHAIEIISICKEKKLKMVEIPVTINYNKDEGDKGQKLTNAFFIVLRLFASQVIKQKILFTVMLTVTVTSCWRFHKLSSNNISITAAIAAGIFLLSILIIWILERSLKQLYIKTQQVRASALATTRKVNF